MLAAFRSRLQLPNGCAFGNTFAWGDGDTTAVIPPPTFTGGNASHRTDVYVQNDCLDNPRLVLIPISHDPYADPDPLPDKEVNGIAVVYLTGCYAYTASIIEPNPTAATNRCTGSLTDATEVRGVPLRVFLTEGAVGDLGDTDVLDYPLTIQTCRTVAACE